MADKVDIFELLNKVDEFDIHYFDTLTEDHQKSVQPYTLMLWMNGCKSKIQVVQLNFTMNMNVFEIPTQHKKLLYNLACVASDGKDKKYKWLKKKVKNKKYSNTVDILKRYYNCSTEIARGYVSLVDYAFVENIAIELGEQDDTLKKIKKELE